MKFVDTSRTRSSFDQRIPARDGVELSVDVYLPAEPGDYPVLLTRTPYDNNRACQSPPNSTAPQVPSDRFKLLAAHGFIVVAGDVRGRGDSDGTFVPFVNEAADGADAVAWARRLSESNGRVGMFGTGYAGFTALAAAAQAPVDAVAAWSPFGAAEGFPGRGGAARLDWLLWLHVVGGRIPQPVGVPLWETIFGSRPLTQMHQVLGREDAPWPTWLEHLDPGDPFWSALDLGDVISVMTPTLLVTGWWDVNLPSTLRHWRALSSAPSSPTPQGHRLVVGPWDSANTRRPRSEVGGVAWGPASVVDPDDLLIDWFDGNLRDGAGRARPGLPPVPEVRAFVTGRNRWATFEDWPGDASGEASDGQGGRRTQTLWLTSRGCANTRVGDGRLVTDPPSDVSADRFVHDPDNPVPWQPGPVSFARTDSASFTLDTSFATSRDDTLAYVAAPALGPTLFRGRPVVHLWAESDLVDADWVVELEDVFPGSTRSVHLAHGIVRAGAIDGTAEGGGPGAFVIAMTDIAHELQPGHALRLVVASSLFPLYAVNLGGDDYSHGAEGRLGQHTVYHGPLRPSRIELPVG